jgi:hypothetical protein
MVHHSPLPHLESHLSIIYSSVTPVRDPTHHHKEQSLQYRRALPKLLMYERCARSSCLLGLSIIYSKHLCHELIVAEDRRPVTIFWPRKSRFHRRTWVARQRTQTKTLINFEIRDSEESHASIVFGLRCVSHRRRQHFLT